VKGWLARAGAETVRRGRHLAAVRWARWFPRAHAVAESQLQQEGEPYPGHWRNPPAAWPGQFTAEPEASRALHTGLRCLPDLWRQVLWARDVDHRAPMDVAQQLGLTVDQEQRILAMARAALRDRLAELATRRELR
jgi:RNA polymerase sigma-70 factor (ECF subfamily)